MPKKYPDFKIENIYIPGVNLMGDGRPDGNVEEVLKMIKKGLTEMQSTTDGAIKFISNLATTCAIPSKKYNFPNLFIDIVLAELKSGDKKKAFLAVEALLRNPKSSWIVEDNRNLNQFFYYFFHKDRNKQNKDEADKEFIKFISTLKTKFQIECLRTQSLSSDEKYKICEGLIKKAIENKQFTRAYDLLSEFVYGQNNYHLNYNLPSDKVSVFLELLGQIEKSGKINNKEEIQQIKKLINKKVAATEKSINSNNSNKEKQNQDITGTYFIDHFTEEFSTENFKVFTPETKKSFKKAGETKSKRSFTTLINRLTNGTNYPKATRSSLANDFFKEKETEKYLAENFYKKDEYRSPKNFDPELFNDVLEKFPKNKRLIAEYFLKNNKVSADHFNKISKEVFKGEDKSVKDENKIKFINSYLVKNSPAGKEFLKIIREFNFSDEKTSIKSLLEENPKIVPPLAETLVNKEDEYFGKNFGKSVSAALLKSLETVGTKLKSKEGNKKESSDYYQQICEKYVLNNNIKNNFIIKYVTHLPNEESQFDCVKNIIEKLLKTKQDKDKVKAISLFKEAFVDSNDDEKKIKITEKNIKDFFDLYQAIPENTSEISADKLSYLKQYAKFLIKKESVGDFAKLFLEFGRGLLSQKEIKSLTEIASLLDEPIKKLFVSEVLEIALRQPKEVSFKKYSGEVLSIKEPEKVSFINLLRNLNDLKPDSDLVEKVVKKSLEKANSTTVYEIIKCLVDQNLIKSDNVNELADSFKKNIFDKKDKDKKLIAEKLDEIVSLFKDESLKENFVKIVIEKILEEKDGSVGDPVVKLVTDLFSLNNQKNDNKNLYLKVLLELEDKINSEIKSNKNTPTKDSKSTPNKSTPNKSTEDSDEKSDQKITPSIINHLIEKGLISIEQFFTILDTKSNQQSRSTSGSVGLGTPDSSNKSQNQIVEMTVLLLQETKVDKDDFEAIFEKIKTIITDESDKEKVVQAFLDNFDKDKIIGFDELTKIVGKELAKEFKNHENVFCPPEINERLKQKYQDNTPPDEAGIKGDPEEITVNTRCLINKIVELNPVLKGVREEYSVMPGTSIQGAIIRALNPEKSNNNYFSSKEIEGNKEVKVNESNLKNILSRIQTDFKLGSILKLEFATLVNTTNAKSSGNSK